MEYNVIQHAQPRDRRKFRLFFRWPVVGLRGEGNLMIVSEDARVSALMAASLRWHEGTLRSRQFDQSLFSSFPPLTHLPRKRYPRESVEHAVHGGVR